MRRKMTSASFAIAIAVGLILLFAACANVENGGYANGAGVNLGAAPSDYETPPEYEAAPTPSPTPRPVAPPEIMGLHPPAPDEEIHPSLTPSEPLNLPIVQSTVSAGHNLSVVLDEEGNVWRWGGYYIVPTPYEFLHMLVTTTYRTFGHSMWHLNEEPFNPRIGRIDVLPPQNPGEPNRYYLLCMNTNEWVSVNYLFSLTGEGFETARIANDEIPVVVIGERIFDLPTQESLAVMLTPRRTDFSDAAVFVDQLVPNFFMVCEDGNLYFHENRWDENVAYFRSTFLSWRPPGGQARSGYREMRLYRDGRILLRGNTMRTLYGNPRVIASTMGYLHILMLAYDYNLFSLGSGLAIGVPNHLMGTEPVLIMENVAQIAAGAEHSMALTHDNRLYAWGRNGDGRVGNGTRTSAQRPVFIMDNVIAISAGDSSSFAITSDGVLYGWGCNRYGQVGVESANPAVPSHTRPVAIMENIALVSAGVNHTLAVTHDGVLYGWGGNDAGQLGDGTTYSQTTPIRIMEGVRLP